MNGAVILLRFSMEIYGSYWKMRDKFEVLKFGLMVITGNPVFSC